MTLTPRGSNDPHPTPVLSIPMSTKSCRFWALRLGPDPVEVEAYGEMMLFAHFRMNNEYISENKMIVAEEIEQCVKRDGTVLRGATGRDFMPFPGSLSQEMTCKCKRRDVLRCKYEKLDLSKACASSSAPGVLRLLVRHPSLHSLSHSSSHI